MIARDGALDFDAMQMRLHPAESRVRKLAGEIPATFVAFDLLLWKGKPVHERPIEKRRAELEKVGDGFELSPVSDDVEQGTEWLQTLQAAGFDGVVAKKLGLPVPPRLARRSRQGQAAQDGGLRRRRDPLEEGRPRDDRDTPARPLRRRRRPQLRRFGRGRGEEPGRDRGQGAAARGQEERPPLQRAEPLGHGELEETALKPKLVVEVRFDKLEKHRFRHGTRLLRFRPDKNAEGLHVARGPPAAPPRRLAVEDLLR